MVIHSILFHRVPQQSLGRDENTLLHLASRNSRLYFGNSNSRYILGLRMMGNREFKVSRRKTRRFLVLILAILVLALGIVAGCRLGLHTYSGRGMSFKGTNE